MEKAFGQSSQRLQRANINARQFARIEFYKHVSFLFACSDRQPTGDTRIIDVDTLTNEFAIRSFTDQKRRTLSEIVIDGTRSLTIAQCRSSVSTEAKTTRWSVESSAVFLFVEIGTFR